MGSTMGSIPVFPNLSPPNLNEKIRCRAERHTSGAQKVSGLDVLGFRLARSGELGTAVVAMSAC